MGERCVWGVSESLSGGREIGFHFRFFSVLCPLCLVCKEMIKSTKFLKTGKKKLLLDWSYEYDPYRFE